MRSFIRHPTDIPIEMRLEGQTCKHELLRNVSRGGLCFLYPEAAPVGSTIIVRIALTSPPFEARCQVTWRSEEHTSELQSHLNLVCRLLLGKKKKANIYDSFSISVEHTVLPACGDTSA